MMNKSNLEMVGEIADTCDNLLCGMKMPLPPKIHLEALESSIRRMREDLRRVYVTETGNNPWEEIDD